MIFLENKTRKKPLSANAVTSKLYPIPICFFGSAKKIVNKVFDMCVMIVWLFEINGFLIDEYILMLSTDWMAQE